MRLHPAKMLPPLARLGQNASFHRSHAAKVKAVPSLGKEPSGVTSARSPSAPPQPTLAPGHRGPTAHICDSDPKLLDELPVWRIPDKGPDWPGLRRYRYRPTNNPRRDGHGVLPPRPSRSYPRGSGWGNCPMPRLRQALGLGLFVRTIFVAERGKVNGCATGELHSRPVPSAPPLSA
jgi:hypothetical protein